MRSRTVPMAIAMNEAAETLNVSFSATPASVRRIRQEIAQRATSVGLSGQSLDDVVLAVSEAATNVVRHAYSDKVGTIELLAGVVGCELWVIVADSGCGFQTPSEDPGLGHGLALMAIAAADFEIAARARGGTEVRLRFRLPGPRS